MEVTYPHFLGHRIYNDKIVKLCKTYIETLHATGTAFKKSIMMVVYRAYKIHKQHFPTKLTLTFWFLVWSWGLGRLKNVKNFHLYVLMTYVLMTYFDMFWWHMFWWHHKGRNYCTNSMFGIAGRWSKGWGILNIFIFNREGITQVRD